VSAEVDDEPSGCGVCAGTLRPRRLVLRRMFIMTDYRCDACDAPARRAQVRPGAAALIAKEEQASS